MLWKFAKEYRINYNLDVLNSSAFGLAGSGGFGGKGGGASSVTSTLLKREVLVYIVKSINTLQHCTFDQYTSLDAHSINTSFFVYML